MNRTILVTGGAGFVGSHIVEALVERGERVRVLDNFSTGHSDNLARVRGKIELVEGDVTDPAVVARVMRDVDRVSHQAALASVPLSLERPLEVHAACATGTLVVLEAARRAGVRRLIYAGSSSCYGNQSVAACRESDPVSPLSPYAAAKLAGEMYCQAFYRSFGLETVVLRYFNVYGPRQDPASPYAAVIPIFISRLTSGQRPVIYGDGRQSRDFVYVADVVEANLRALDTDGIGGMTFNVASGRALTLLDLVAALGRILGQPVEPRFEPARPGDVRHSAADMTLVERWLGLGPRMSLAEGLHHSIEYYSLRVAGTDAPSTSLASREVPNEVMK